MSPFFGHPQRHGTLHKSFRLRKVWSFFPLAWRRRHRRHATDREGRLPARTALRFVFRLRALALRLVLVLPAAMPFLSIPISLMPFHARGECHGTTPARPHAFSMPGNRSVTMPSRATVLTAANRWRGQLLPRGHPRYTRSKEGARPLSESIFRAWRSPVPRVKSKGGRS